MSSTRLGNLNNVTHVTTITELTAALTANNYIKIAEGTYTISTTLSVPSGCVLEGSGPENTIFQPDASLSGVMMSTTTTNNNIVIKDLKFDGLSATWTSDNNLLSINNSDDVYVINCHFTDNATSQDCIDILGDSQRVTISECKFFSCAGLGVAVADGDHVNILHSQFNSVTNSPIRVDSGSTKVVCSGNLFLTSSGSVSISGDDVVLDNNIFDAITGVGLSGTDHVIVSNNRILNSSSVAILISGVTNSVVSGNHISDASNNAIGFSGTNTDILFTDNVVENNSVRGFFFSVATTGIAIVDNIITDNTNEAINVNSNDDIIIRGNKISGNGGTINSVSSTSNVIIRDNNITETLTASPITAYASVVSVDSTAGAINPLTIPNLNEASAGFELLIKSTVSANTITIVPSSIGADLVNLATSYTNVILNAVGEWASFTWTGRLWNIKGVHSGAAITA